MIDVKHLRAGNFVAIDYQGAEKLPCSVLIIDGVDNGVFTDLADQLFISGEDLEAIPLTAEWLGRFEGFYFLESQNLWNGRWGENGSALIKWHNGYDLWAIELGQGFSKVFRYVHQFQNFWQALTENELKIKQ